jgi:hypothetical protein
LLRPYLGHQPGNPSGIESQSCQEHAWDGPAWGR